MYAVIKTGGKQYKVVEGMNLKIEKIEGDAGAKVELGEVLLLGGNGALKIGTPVVAGASVSAEVTKQAKDKKVIVYKKNRRKGYEKRYGHRQPHTEIKVTKINT